MTLRRKRRHDVDLPPRPAQLDLGVAAPSPQRLTHAALNEVGCLYEAGGLARQTRRDAYPVWVFRGVLEKRGDQYLLRATQPKASFMVLDTSSLPEWETRFGLDSLIGWKSRIIRRYTSADVVAPLVAGAASTLQAVDIGGLQDHAHPEGPYSTAPAALRHDIY